MKKLSLVLAFATLFCGSAWAGSPKKQSGSSGSQSGSQSGSSSKKNLGSPLQALKQGGHSASQAHATTNPKPLKAQGIALQNLTTNRPLNMLKGSESAGNHLTTNGAKPFSTSNNSKPLSSPGITLQNLSPKPLQSQGITAQNLKPNRPLNMLKGSEGVGNSLPVGVTQSTPTKPGFVWTGSHWERAKAPAGSVGTPNTPPVTYDNFLTMANNPPPAIRVPVQDPSKPGRPTGGHPQHGPGANGGLTVNWIPGSQRPADVTGVGASPVDNFFGAIGSSLGSDFQPGKLTRPAVSDHR